jgi:hypothetical protein
MFASLPATIRPVAHYLRVPFPIRLASRLPLRNLADCPLLCSAGTSISLAALLQEKGKQHNSLNWYEEYLGIFTSCDRIAYSCFPVVHHENSSEQQKRWD